MVMDARMGEFVSAGEGGVVGDGCGGAMCEDVSGPVDRWETFDS